MPHHSPVGVCRDTGFSVVNASMCPGHEPCAMVENPFMPQFPPL
jgi:hypothetical protein